MDINDVPLEDSIKVDKKKDALIVVDMQYDFLPGGALAIAEADKLIPGINSLIDRFFDNENVVVFTQDWHPKDHASFASSYKDKKPFDPFEAPGIGPVLWPDHCVAGSTGAEIHKDLHVDKGHLIIRKGYHKEIDSYSTFLENDKVTKTGLDGYFKSLGVNRVFIVGLALDYCVFNSANDATNLGFDVVIILDLSKPVGSPADLLPQALSTMLSNGVKFINSDKIKF